MGRLGSAQSRSLQNKRVGPNWITIWLVRFDVEKRHVLKPNGARCFVYGVPRGVLPGLGSAKRPSLESNTRMQNCGRQMHSLPLCASNPFVPQLVQNYVEFYRILTIFQSGHNSSTLKKVPPTHHPHSSSEKAIDVFDLDSNGNFNAVTLSLLHKLCIFLTILVAGLDIFEHYK